jgi:hypothetical protein
MAGVCAGRHVSACYFSPTLTKRQLYRRILVKIPNIKFQENPPCGS